MRRNTCRRVVFSTLCMTLAGAAQAQTLCESVDACGLVWTTSGNAVWIGQTNKTHDGVDAAASGVIGNNRTTSLSTTVVGPGTFTFWWRVSSESDYDYLRFYRTGVLQTSISGEINWEQRIYTIPAGTNSLTWTYSKDDFLALGEDRGWVDQVRFVPDGPLAVQPASDLVSSGYIAGPFNPSNKVYTLTNTSATDFGWGADADQAWVTVTPSGGSLLSGASTNVTVLINANAQSLGYGAQIASVTFTNLTSGVSQTRGVQLTVNVAPATRYVNLLSPAPAIPYDSWATAATNIQNAVDMSVAGDLILVTNGVYQTGAQALYGMSNRVAVTKPVTVQSVNGPEVTSIAGYQVPGINNGAAAVRCVYLTNGAVLSGFTLTGGATQTSGDTTKNRSGGGVWCESGAVVSNTVIQGNSADLNAGGVYSGTLHRCRLTGNTANQGGGSYSSTLNQCTLSGNSASTWGGGTAYSTINNCIITGNSAATAGGAYISTLNNCTITGNSAITGGGVTVGTLRNCILYYNIAQSGENYDPSAVNFSVNYCCTTPLPSSGAGNISAEPRLASKSHLSAESPCRGAGSAAYATGLDLDGEPWANPPSMGCDEYWSGSVTGALTVVIVAAYTNVATGFAVDFEALIEGRVSASRWDYGDGTVVSNRPYSAHAWSMAGDYVVELRAYNETHPNGVTATVVVHVVPPAVHYVSVSSSNPVPPYADWTTAATNIQDAVNVATMPGALVLVSNGVYAAGATAVYGMSNRVAVTKPVTVQSVNGPAVTTIYGYKEFGTNYGPSAVRCAYLTNGAVLSGFTLTNGATQTSGDVDRNRSGGGVWCESTRAVVTDCALTGNLVPNNGGGVYSGTLTNCTLIGNDSKGQGAAFKSVLNQCTLAGNVAGGGGGASASTLNNCTLTNNLSSSGGGALSCTLNNCTLTGNHSAYNPGGGASSSTLNNCTLIGNSAPGQGGGAYSSTLINCTLIGNSAFEGGGTDHCINNNCTLIGNAAARGGGDSYSTLNNCIVYYNTASGSLQTNYNYSTLNYCCTTPLPAGVGNITNEPLFVDTNGWSNLRLQSNSPCINLGNNAYVLNATDLDGLPRISGSTVDMGAYEFQGTGLSGFAAWLWQYGLPTDGSAGLLDSDLDGHNNWQEWVAGTNPTNPVSVLRLGMPLGTPGNVMLTWTSVTNRFYTMESATNLNGAPPFSVLQSNLTGLPGTTSWADTNHPAAGPRYYRVRVEN